MIIIGQVLKVLVLLLSAITHWQRVLTRLLPWVMVQQQDMIFLLRLVLFQVQQKAKRVPLLSVMLLKGKMKMQLQSVIRQRLLRVVLF